MPKSITPQQVKALFPITSVTQYPNGVIKVNRTSVLNHPTYGRLGGGARGEITYLSNRARAHLAFVASTTAVEFRSIITLTYPKMFPSGGRIAKGHLNWFLSWLRSKDAPNNYLWVIEFQKRGAPHFHILSTLPEPTEWQRKEFASQWRKISDPNRWASQNWTTEEILSAKRKLYNVHKHPRAWEAIRDVDGARKYIVKYCLKTTQKVVPDMYRSIGRFYGWSSEVKDSIQAVGTLKITDDEVTVLLEVMNHRTKSWPVPPKYIFGLDLGLDETEENVSRET